MPPLPPDPQYQNKTSQEGNGASTVLKSLFDEKNLTMDITVVTNTVIVDPMKTPPSELSCLRDSFDWTGLIQATWDRIEVV